MRNAARRLNLAAILMTAGFIAAAIGTRLRPELLSFPLLAVAIAQAMSLPRKP